MIPADIVVDYSTMEDENGLCSKCQHAFGPHILMATMISPDHGGMIFCHVPGCLCESTWSIEGEPLPYIPDPETVEHLRQLAQSDEEEEEEEDDNEWGPGHDINIWTE